MKSRTKRARPQKSQPAGGKAQQPKRRRTEEDALEDQQGDIFEHSDQERDVDAADISGDESEEETAEEKRLRLAKAYLQQLRASERGDGSGSEDEATRDAVGERLREDALEAMGQLQRRLAHRLVLRDPTTADAAQPSSSGRTIRCHRLSVTGLALTSDDAVAYSVSKDGAIMRTDIEQGKSSRFEDRSAVLGHVPEQGGADWIAKSAQRGGGLASLLAAAVSSDGRYLAVGGGDRKVHVWDARSQQYIQGFKQHRDIVTGLAFRDGTHELFSGSFDRTIKIFSLDDRAYVDTLYGHQSEVLAVDVLRAERVLSTGQDHTCRVWKVPEESQLIFRGHGQAIECCSYVTGTEWISGGSDGGVALWSQLKKKPVHVVRNAHSASDSTQGGPGSVGGDAAGWVSAVACCRGSDLMASGAGDGLIRLWSLEGERPGAGRTLAPLGALPARGFVNALQIARSARFIVAGIGQEPRLGRWLRDSKAKNGLLIHSLELSED